MGILEWIEENKQESVYVPPNEKTTEEILDSFWNKIDNVLPVEPLIILNNWEFHFYYISLKYPKYKIKRIYHKRIDVMEHRFYKKGELQFRKYINRYGEDYRTKNMLAY